MTEPWQHDLIMLLGGIIFGFLFGYLYGRIDK